MSRQRSVRGLTTVAFVLSTLAAVAGLIAVHGQGWGFTASAATRYVEIGKSECAATATQPWINGVCPSVGYPSGAALGNGMPIALAEGAVNRLPGVTSGSSIDIVNTGLMTLAVMGAIAFFRYWQLGRWLSLGLSVAYLASLGVAGMAGFGSTFWMIAGLPAAIWVYLKALSSIGRGHVLRSMGVLAGLTLFTALILFTDGYGTIFALTAVGIEASCRVIPQHTRRRGLLDLGALLLAVLLGVLLFTLYPSSQSGWGRSDLALFRSMGADLVTFFVPGPSSWWANALGWSGVKDLWGDGTNVNYNFLGYVLLIMAVVGAVLAIRGRKRVAAWAVVGAVAFLLALGPSLKVHEVRGPLTPPVTYASYLMPPDAAVTDLPTKYAYKLVPGLNMLRATYRWHTLAHLSALVLAGYGLSRLQRRGRYAGVATVAIASVIAVEAAPNPIAALQHNARTSQVVMDFETTLAQPLDDIIEPGTRVVFAPGAEGINDYLAWNLGGTGDYVVYNVGGDKALSATTASWPPSILRLIQGSTTFGDDAAEALSSGAVDVIVIPFFDLRWGIEEWPVDAQWRKRGLETLEQAHTDERLAVDAYQYFAIVTLATASGAVSTDA